MVVVVVGVGVILVPGQNRKLPLPVAAAHRYLEAFLLARKTGLPDRRGAPEAAGWAFG